MLTKRSRILLWTYILDKLNSIYWLGTCKVVPLFGIRPYVFAIRQELTKGFAKKSFKSNFNWMVWNNLFFLESNSDTFVSFYEDNIAISFCWYFIGNVGSCSFVLNLKSFPCTLFKWSTLIEPIYFINVCI